MTALAIFGAALLLAGSVIGHAMLIGRQHAEPAAAPDPQPEPEQPFNVTALAVLQPDDPRLPDEDAACIAAAVADAIDDYADCLIAHRTGLDPDAVDRLEQRLYTRLTGALTPEQIARALVMGLHEHAAERAAHLTDTDRLSVSDLGDS